MIDKYARAYSDIIYILRAIEHKYTEQIPNELLEFFRKNADQEYISKIDLSKSLVEQEISKETEQLICLLNLNYWCSPTEKQELLKKYQINEDEIQQQLRNKYEIKFNKNIKIEDVKSIAIIKKENVFSKIIKFIKRILIKKK